MAQYSLGTIDPQSTSGTQLANRLTQWSAAVNSNNSGPTAPTYGVQGMIWMDTGTAGFVTKRVFDGTDWVAVETLNIATNALSFPGVSALGANVNFLQVSATSGDLWSHGWGGDDNQGVVFLNGARTAYLHFTGAAYYLNGASLRVGGDIGWGTQGAILSVDGNLYMPWAGQYLSTYLGGVWGGINARQPLGDYATHGYNQFNDTQFVYWTGAAKTIVAHQATIGSFDGVLHYTRVNRGGSSAFYFYQAVSDYDNTKDVEFRVRGDGVVTADGGITGGGADYAEYFEWQDGNPDGEDRVGYTVVTGVGGKIFSAEDAAASDNIIGVISGKPTVVGDSQDTRWSGQYEKDAFGREVRQQVERLYYREQVGLTNPKAGGKAEPVYEVRTMMRDQWPADQALPLGAEVHKEWLRVYADGYDADREYVPREFRLEWDAVGLMGKLWVRKGMPVNPRWILLETGKEADRYLVR